MVQEIEDTADAQRKRNGKQPLGPDAIRRQDPPGGGRSVEIGGPARPVSDRQLSASSPVRQGVPLGVPRARVAPRSEAKDSNHPPALPEDLISPGVTVLTSNPDAGSFRYRKGRDTFPFSKPSHFG
jgi:hypothetical protein